MATSCVFESATAFSLTRADQGVIHFGFSGIDRNDGPLKVPLKGDFNPNAIHVFTVNLTWRF
jgi:hypothetical protein